MAHQGLAHTGFDMRGRWRSNADKAMPIYLAQADGMRFRVIQTLEGSG